MDWSVGKKFDYEDCDGRIEGRKRSELSREISGRTGKIDGVVVCGESEPKRW